MSDLDTTQAPQGKGQAVGGFILALVGIVVPFNAIAVLAGSMILSYLGLALCIISIVLCGMAMGKLKKSGQKRGLAIAGLVIGLVATVWMAMAIAPTMVLVEARNQGVSELQGMDADDIRDAMEQAQ